MMDWLSMKWAHIQDALAIWDGSPMCPSFDWLKVKASICIALNRESFFGDCSEHCPVWASSPMNYWSYDGPGQRWQEVAVHPSWRVWKFSRYENGF